jgi:hypothetical protein
MLLLLLAVFLPRLALADEPNQAGLFVEFGDGQVVTRCVTFDEGEISGADLLTRSGLEVVVDASSGMGVIVCQIEGEGCDYPTGPCFCQCMGGGECAYWNYYYRDPGETDWTYSPLGAVARQVRHGSIEAWVWGNGHTPPAAELSLEAICVLPTPMLGPTGPVGPTNAVGPTDTIEPMSIAEPSNTAEPPAPTSPATPTAVLISPTVMLTLTPTQAITDTPLPPASSPVSVTGTSLSSYWPFGLMLLGLAVVGTVVWLRRR